MWWNRILTWFTGITERQRCVNDFNNAAREAFISNVVPVFMRAETSRGNSSYRHAMSNFFVSGFRIRTLSGKRLTADEVRGCGAAIITNQELMRRLATLGFDTLEIYSPEGEKIKDWPIKEIMQIGY